MGKKKRPAILVELPFQLIITILSKLPFKSLLRFRCVCKQWLSLISETQFIKTHLTESIKSGRQRLICSFCTSDCFYSVDYETLGGGSKILSYFEIEKDPNASVLCSCNGLLLMGLDNANMYVLWNSSTKEYKGFSCPYSKIGLKSFHGICYDSSINDHKVLIIYVSKDYRFSYFVVYTCKTNSWTECREFPYRVPNGVGITASGVLHYEVLPKKGRNLGYLEEQKHGGRDGYNDNSLTPTDEVGPSYYERIPWTTSAIIFFDLVEDKFKEVSPPNWICDGNVFHLTVMRGCLSLYLRTSDLQRFDIWTMKQHGNRNSWTKLISIPSKVGSTNLDFLKPVCCTKKGEVVLMDNSRIFFYDPKGSKLRNLTLSDGFLYPSEMVLCVDSLVFPSSDTSTKKRQHKQRK